MTEANKRRFIDSGWRLTIPKPMRERLGWDKGTPVCVVWDGWTMRIKSPLGCVSCPDVTRMGALGKIVIPPKVRAEAGLYPGLVMSLWIEDDAIVAKPDTAQVRCAACGSELDVRMTLPNVYLCRRCREALADQAVRRLKASQEGSGPLYGSSF